eukprot:1361439-Amorphochlora_amoeboformis.AAC.1
MLHHLVQFDYWEGQTNQRTTLHQSQTGTTQTQTQTQGQGGIGTRGQGDREAGRQGDREAGRQEDRETGRQGDRETGRQDRARTGIDTGTGPLTDVALMRGNSTDDGCKKGKGRVGIQRWEMTE